MSPLPLTSPLGLDWPPLEAHFSPKKTVEKADDYGMKRALFYVWDDVLGDTSEEKAYEMFQKEAKGGTSNMTSAELFPINCHNKWCCNWYEVVRCNSHFPVGKIKIFGHVFYRGLYSSTCYEAPLK